MSNYKKVAGQLTGFLNAPKNPKAPISNMEMTITREWLEQKLSAMEAAGVTEATVDYVLFQSAGVSQSGKQWAILNAFPAKAEQRKVKI